MFKATRHLVELKHKSNKSTSCKPNPALHHPSLSPEHSQGEVHCAPACMEHPQGHAREQVSS